MSTVSGANQGGYVQPTTSSSDVTDRGTKVVQPGQNDDENTFIKILVAEMSNQDPTSQSQDPTQYISQLAQFSSLEQMTNLNTTMKLNGAASLLGKAVEFNALDANGQNYVGVVKGISKNGDNITLDVVTSDSGTESIKQFDYSQIMAVADAAAVGSGTGGSSTPSSGTSGSSSAGSSSTNNSGSTTKS
ncbi:MAG: flagellar hook capping FlgD N-terminal domain-containing protein [Clostridium sp.]|nr:flagellar hook capping FlgD N-terminal domain-containing protein [Clostridium sp.]